MAKIICSHGFGVRADARGMFTDLSQAMPEHEFILFDYNTFDTEGNTIVSSLDVQASTLQDVIDKNPDTDTLLCHSQGCVIAGLVDISNIKQVILLAPPVKMSMERTIEKMMNKPGSQVDLGGMSKLARSGGGVTLLPKEYIESLQDKNLLELYEKVSSTKPTVIIRSMNDEVLGLTNLTDVRSAKIIDMEADHNFTRESRDTLISQLKSIRRAKHNL